MEIQKYRLINPHILGHAVVEKHPVKQTNKKKKNIQNSQKNVQCDAMPRDDEKKKQQ